MIKIEHPVFPSTEQMLFVIEGMRNPKNSWDKSDSIDDCVYDSQVTCETCKHNLNPDDSLCPTDGFVLGENDESLMLRLAKAGTDHRKYLRMMQVGVRITAPLYFYKELDTYKVGTVCNSCSTMHKIQAKEFTLDDFSCEHLVEDNDVYEDISIPDGEEYIYYAPKDILQEWIIPSLNKYRNVFLKTKNKVLWWQMIQLLPSSYNQTRNYTFTYENLINMYFARRNHKLDEWRIFCQWMLDNVPYFKDLVEHIQGQNKVDARAV